MQYYMYKPQMFTIAIIISSPQHRISDAQSLSRISDAQSLSSQNDSDAIFWILLHNLFKNIFLIYVENIYQWYDYSFVNHDWKDFNIMEKHETMHVLNNISFCPEIATDWVSFSWNQLHNPSSKSDRDNISSFCYD